MNGPGFEQSQWVAWIWAQPGAAPPASLRPVGPLPLERGLAAYREHAKALAVRALAAQYPLLQQWMGEPDFAGLAWAYGRAHPPRCGDVDRWGHDLATYLEGLPGMDAEPPALARLEAHLHALADGADDPPPDAGLWQRLRQGDPAALRLRWSPTLALFAAPEGLDAWLDGGNEPLGFRAQGWILAWRRGWKPCRAWVSAGWVAWLQAQAAGASLDDGLRRVGTAHPDFELGAALQLAWAQGWLLGVEPMGDGPA